MPEYNWRKVLHIELSEVVIPDLAKIITEYVPEHSTDSSVRRGISVFGLYQEPFVSYYDNECKHLCDRLEYVNGQLHGIAEGWNKNGQQRCKCNYFNDQRHGVDEGWYENGQRWYKCNYVNGLKHGVDEGWYYNGRKRNKWNYDNGKLHGVSEGWYENGQQKYKYNYDNGQLVIILI